MAAWSGQGVEDLGGLYWFEYGCLTGRPANEPSKPRITIAQTRLGLAMAQLGLLREPKPYLGLGSVRLRYQILFSVSACANRAERTIVSDSAQCARWRLVATVTRLVAHKLILVSLEIVDLCVTCGRNHATMR
jgi:hypothetical protein